MNDEWWINELTPKGVWGNDELWMMSDELTPKGV